MTNTFEFPMDLNNVKGAVKVNEEGTDFWVPTKLENAYDPIDDMVKMKSVQKKFRDSFSGAALDTNKWQSVIGTGGAVTQAAGQLTIGSGTGINQETYILSKDVFTIPFRLSIGMTLSQRIANNSFLVEMISVDPVSLLPDGKHVAAFLFDGTNAAQAKYRVGNGGLTPLDSALSTFPTSASGSVYELEAFADEVWFHGGLLDSTNARSNSYRRHQQIPDPNAFYKIRLRMVNGATAPASNTNAVVQYLAVQDYAELTAEITAGRGQSVAGQAIGVQITGAVTVPVSGSTTAAGQAAHDAVISGNPNRIGARAVSANYAAVASGDQADLISTLVGALISKPYSIPEADWNYASAGAIITTADTVLKAAAGAGLRNYLTSVQCINSNATATEIVIKDGTTVIWRGYLPGNSGLLDLQFPTPIKTAANAALNFACITTGASVYVNAQGYVAP